MASGPKNKDDLQAEMNQRNEAEVEETEANTNEDAETNDSDDS